MPKTETLEEYLKRGGVIKKPKAEYPIKHKINKTILPRKKRPPPPIKEGMPHGRSRYAYGCRCEKCKESNAIYMRKKRQNETHNS